MKTIKDKEYFRVLRIVIEKRLRWGESYKWTHSNFDQMSEMILEQTKTSLSSNTLKRFWGKMKSDSEPSMATKNALSKFAGFKDWKHFMLEAEKSFIEKQKKSKMNPTRWVVAILVIAGIILLPIIRKGIYKDISPSEVKFDSTSLVFEVKEDVGKVPFSVHFNYDISSVEADSVWVCHEWNKHVELPRDKNDYTVLHFIPGFYTPKLMADGQVIATTTYQALSEGWVFIYPFHTWEPRNYYYPDTVNRGYFQVTTKELDSLKVDLEHDKNWLRFHYVRDFDAKMNDLVFTTAMRNDKNNGGFTCQDCCFTLVGDKGSIYMHFTEKGCARNAGYVIGDKSVNGTNNDLSFMGADFAEWKQVQVISKDNNVEVKIEGETIFNDNIDKDLGQLKGLKYSFRGSGAIDYVRIKDNSGREVYTNEF